MYYSYKSNVYPASESESSASHRMGVPVELSRSFREREPHQSGVHQGFRLGLRVSDGEKLHVDLARDHQAILLFPDLPLQICQVRCTGLAFLPVEPHQDNPATHAQLCMCCIYSWHVYV